MSTEPAFPEVVVGTRSKPRERTRRRRLPPYHVILENDDHHSFEFVVDVLCKTLGCTGERALQLALVAHHNGRAVVWTGSKEVAELKADQIRTFHEVREGGVQLGPLGCTIEPAPGG
jgi:ATP-dependent Clp protease adaptor protein ClpS